MGKNKSKSREIDFGDLPSNYVLKVRDALILNERKGKDATSEEILNNSNLKNKIDKQIGKNSIY
ncbi:hypothetical protein [Clostridium rectalis]|uniref:hypothetical protein n=1 Tax=Clostridium rectalis TaxID=2040295 RepID=UPI000F62DB92|nr:hypothetical protein [Clostridium rectalis]